jgi:uncharacterized protein (DUF952 family)
MDNDRIIYHITPADYYDSQPADQPYRSQRFAEEGFIHCTKGEERVLLVANTVYRKIPGKFWLLVIDERKVTAEIRYEIVGEILFPHIHGPLNRDAIIRVQEMARADDGTFLTIGIPPEPVEALSVHPAAVATRTSIEDVLSETRRLRKVTAERIEVLEREIQAFMTGQPAPAAPPAAAPAKVSLTPAKPSEFEQLAERIARLEQQLVETRSILVDRMDKLEARLKRLEKKRASAPAKAQAARPKKPAKAK